MKNTININGKLLSLDKPKIMGIINSTPDSFYKDSRFNLGEKSFLLKAEKMLADGCHIFDVGGYSTRPNATEVTENEEIDRIRKPIRLLKRHFPDIPISIDTFRAEVAKAAIEEGAGMINDVSGGSLDGKMFEYVISKNIPYILMHMRGNPQTMQNHTVYKDLSFEVVQEIVSKANYLRSKGVHDVIVDPGFGFAKNINQNYELLKNIRFFQNPFYPVLMGISRKSMIYKLLNSNPEDVLPETTALHLFGILNKVQIVRVHDVLNANRILNIYEKITP